MGGAGSALTIGGRERARECTADDGFWIVDAEGAFDAEGMTSGDVDLDAATGVLPGLAPLTVSY